VLEIDTLEREQETYIETWSDPVDEAEDADDDSEEMADDDDDDEGIAEDEAIADEDEAGAVTLAEGEGDGEELCSGSVSDTDGVGDGATVLDADEEATGVELDAADDGRADEEETGRVDDTASSSCIGQLCSSPLRKDAHISASTSNDIDDTPLTLLMHPLRNSTRPASSLRVLQSRAMRRNERSSKEQRNTQLSRSLHIAVS
jgi:hypothetical protein